MGSDKLFHRRRARSIRNLQRRKALRDSYDRALIVCEGSKTEPMYFSDWRDRLRLKNANIEIIGDCGSDPLSVVIRGIELSEKGEFDRVFCVFDKDKHKNYEDALQRIDGQDPDVFSAIISVPCFEYWLVLHYQFTTRSLTSAQAIAKTREYIDKYRKGKNGVAAITFSRVDRAIRNAIKGRKQSASDGFDNPYTNVDELIVYLRSLKN